DGCALVAAPAARRGLPCRSKMARCTARARSSTPTASATKAAGACAGAGGWCLGRWRRVVQLPSGRRRRAGCVRRGPGGGTGKGGAGGGGGGEGGGGGGCALRHTRPPLQRGARCPTPARTTRCRVYGKRHGQGAYYYLDGGRYEGEWQDDRIQGKGKSVY